MSRLEYLIHRFNICKSQEVINLALYKAFKQELSLYENQQ